jgi:ribose transport system permease protein
MPSRSFPLTLPGRGGATRSPAVLFALRGARLAVAIAFCGILFGVGAAVISGFATRFSVSSILVLSSLLGIAAAGQTMVVLLGGIDLSIPYVIGVADVVGAELTQRGTPFWESVLVVLAIAFAIGLFNGFVSAGLGIHPLIVTLGVGFVVQGGVQIWTGGQPSGLAPGWLTSAIIPGRRTGPIPFPPIVVFWMGFALLVLLLLRGTIFGQRLYAVGANPQAARLALVSPVRVWALTFGVSAVCAAVAGLLLLGFSGSALATIGDPYLFLSVGAVVVGGTSLLGGRGGYGGTVAGAIILTELTTILIGVGLPDALQQVFLGIIIVLVVSIYGREPHVRNTV